MPSKKSNRKKRSTKTRAKTKAKTKAKGVHRKKALRRTKSAKRSTPTSSSTLNPGVSARIHQGVGLKEVPPSPDAEGLSTTEDVDSESVAELVDEGQDFEAEVVSGVENARDPDQSEVKTREVPEDDVPEEYRDYRETDN